MKEARVGRRRDVYGLGKLCWEGQLAGRLLLLVCFRD